MNSKVIHTQKCAVRVVQAHYFPADAIVHQFGVGVSYALAWAAAGGVHTCNNVQQLHFWILVLFDFSRPRISITAPITSSAVTDKMHFFC